ncbi:MAG: hypothetical protein MESAZ_02709 [Saezia sanguinis]
MNTGLLHPTVDEGKTSSAIAASAQPAVQVTATSAASHLKYFGHFFTATGHQNAVAEHTNLSVIDWSFSSDNNLFVDLAVLKSKGNKAVISTPNLFTPRVNGVQYYNLLGNASLIWSSFMQQLVSRGFYDVANPENGTVIGFYPLDEPELAGGMVDVNGAPSPKLVQIINILRSNYQSRFAPLATCASIYYANAIEGYKLFDWVGLNAYMDKDDEYEGKFRHLRTLLNPNQKMILVPQATIFKASNQTEQDDYSYHSADRMLFIAQTEASVLAIVPYQWNSEGNGITGIIGLGSGAPELQGLRQRYEQIGKQVKFAGANASLVGYLIPTTMVAGGYYSIRVDMRNTGNVAWEPGVVFLGTQSPHDNTIWGSHRVWIPRRIQPGEIAQIVFDVMAPRTPGNYVMQGRMVAEEITWFGDLTAYHVVNVVAG